MEIETGFTELDEKLGGIKKGEIICIAARPAMGKTTFALNLITNFAIQQIPTAIFSLDNNKSMLTDRIKDIECRVSHTLLETSINLLLFEKYINIYDNILDITGIEQRARKLKLQENIGLIVIDYLQLIKHEGALEEVIIRLKTLAKELNIPIIILSQLSKELESREDKRPLLSDFKNSACLTDYADTILFVYRDDFYNKHSEKPYVVEVIVAKTNRNITGTAELLDIRNRYVNIERDRR